MAADNEFHAQLYSAADKQDIWALVKSRSGHIDRLRRLHLPRPARRRISCASQADRQSDRRRRSRRAQKHLRTHLSGTLSELAQIRARHPEYLSD
jgi:hypothetical protein